MQNVPFLDQFSAYSAPAPKPVACLPGQQPFRIHPKHVSGLVNLCLRNKKWYLVSQDLLQSGEFDQPTSQGYLYEGVNLDGQSFLLVSTLPWGPGSESWADSMEEMVVKARRNWTTRITDKIRSVHVSKIDCSIDEKPCWWPGGFEDLVRQVFERGGYVMTLDNPHGKIKQAYFMGVEEEEV